MQKLSDRFRGQGLACARLAVQQEDAPSTLAGDDVGKRGLVVLDQPLDELLFLRREHQAVERQVVELDVFGEVEVDFAPLLGGEAEAEQRRPAHEEMILLDPCVVARVLSLFRHARVGVIALVADRVDHYPSVRLEEARTTPGLLEQVSGIRLVVRADAVLGALAPALRQLRFLLSFQRPDRKVGDAPGAVEAVDAGAFLGREELLAVRPDDLVADLDVRAEERFDQAACHHRPSDHLLFHTFARGDDLGARSVEMLQEVERDVSVIAQVPHLLDLNSLALLDDRDELPHVRRNGSELLDRI
mmetsp:Transcript_10747/g.25699  ORF Transcript_10747/g.25699 Transcript_10747/m.25699 type:complete len:302 (-) Transcript_10747:695-1600(-)